MTSVHEAFRDFQKLFGVQGVPQLVVGDTPGGTVVPAAVFVSAVGIEAVCPAQCGTEQGIGGLLLQPLDALHIFLAGESVQHTPYGGVEFLVLVGIPELGGAAFRSGFG